MRYLWLVLGRAVPVHLVLMEQSHSQVSSSNLTNLSWYSNWFMITFIWTRCAANHVCECVIQILLVTLRMAAKQHYQNFAKHEIWTKLFRILQNFTKFRENKTIDFCERILRNSY